MVNIKKILSEESIQGEERRVLPFSWIQKVHNFFFFWNFIFLDFWMLFSPLIQNVNIPSISIHSNFIVSRCHVSFIWVSLFSCFSQRAWLLKLLAVELHAGDMVNSTHRDACQSILGHIFGPDVVDFTTDHSTSHAYSVHNSAADVGTRTISKSKVYLGT